MPFPSKTTRHLRSAASRQLKSRAVAKESRGSGRIRPMCLSKRSNVWIAPAMPCAVVMVADESDADPDAPVLPRRTVPSRSREQAGEPTRECAHLLPCAHGAMISAVVVVVLIAAQDASDPSARAVVSTAEGALAPGT